jgi:hypothetical protein
MISSCETEAGSHWSFLARAAAPSTLEDCDFSSRDFN